MRAYYQLIDRDIDQAQRIVRSHFQSTPHAQGTWNEEEQHMAAVAGILSHELERYFPADKMRIGRLSFDIFGMIHFGDFTIETRTIRAGKSIELIEANMIARGKTSVLARAWRMQTSDTREVFGVEDLPLLHPETLPIWDGIHYWKGGFVDTIEARANDSRRPGKGFVWLRTPLALVANEPSSEFVRLMGLVDVANGCVTRLMEETTRWIYPNLDLQIHLYRQAAGEWLGIEAVQQFGSDGIGLTSAVLHDVHGPFGRSEQILTVRKIA